MAKKKNKEKLPAQVYVIFNLDEPGEDNIRCADVDPPTIDEFDDQTAVGLYKLVKAQTYKLVDL